MHAAEEGEDGDAVGSLHLAATRDGEERLGEVRVEDRGEGRGERDERDGAGDAEEDRGVEESRGGLGEVLGVEAQGGGGDGDSRARGGFRGRGGGGVARETRDVLAGRARRRARRASRRAEYRDGKRTHRVEDPSVPGRWRRGRRGSETEILDDEVGDSQLRAREGGRRRSAIPRVPGADEVEAWEGGAGAMIHAPHSSDGEFHPRALVGRHHRVFLLRLW